MQDKTKKIAGAPRLESQRFLALIVSVMATGMAFIDATGLNVAIPAIQQSLDATGVQMLWIINAYALPLTAFLLLAGGLSDRFGLKRVFFMGIALFAFGSLLCGTARTVELLIVFRAVQGLGAAMMIPASLALLTTVYPADQRGRAIGLWSALTAITMIIGPLVGGWMAHLGFWRGFFLINLPIALAALYGLSRLRVLTAHHNKLPLDFVGSFLAASALSCLTLAVLLPDGFGWASWWMMALLTIALCSLLGFIWTQIRIANPILPLHLFRSRAFSLASALTILLYTALYGITIFLPLNLVQIQGFTTIEAGMALLPVMLLIVVFAPLSGRLVDRAGPARPLLFGTVCCSAGIAMLATSGVTQGPGDYWSVFFAPLCLLGVGMGLTISPLSATVMNSVPSQHLGLASGINSTLARLAGVLAVVLMGSVVLLAFPDALMRHARDLPSGVRHWLLTFSPKWGDMNVPDHFDSATRASCAIAIRQAFNDTFGLMAWICCALTAAASMVSLGFVGCPRTDTTTIELFHENKLGLNEC